MAITKISPDHSIKIPESLRQQLPPGQEVVINVDSHGRMVVTPVAQILSALRDTFGMWADRDDIPDDAVAYVNELRQGERLDAVMRRLDETV